MASKIHPAYFQWDGDAMIPDNAFLADRQYAVGEKYRLGPIEERSANSHNHFFACVTESWRNLPEDAAARFPTPDHLRYFALIKAGYRDERSIVCASKAEALRMAAFVSPMDGYAIVTVKECVVIVYTAKSQSYRAMGKAEFQKSKQAVLDIASDMVGVTTETLKQNAGVAA